MLYFIYIRPNVHVYYIYMYIIIYTVFPCLQDLARLKIALYILAHVPKSLLDPDLTRLSILSCMFCLSPLSLAFLKSLVSSANFQF